MSAQPAEQQFEDSTLDAEISSLISDLIDEHEASSALRFGLWRVAI